ncbi:hypothetical protein L7F22_025421 [Adiantum nelumboides]|nr:hypothetical protein [Adiantum nelumboides]
MESKLQSLKTLPLFIGKHEAKSEVRILQSQMRAIPKMIDTKSLREMLSILTLSELLRIRPHLWEEMGKHLEAKGIKNPLQTNPVMEEKKLGDQTKAQPVPTNKVGDYCEGEEGNTTLLVEYNGIKTIAILNSRARVAIATKQILEKWDIPALRKTRMKLQLANGDDEGGKDLRASAAAVAVTAGIKVPAIFI